MSSGGKKQVKAFQCAVCGYWSEEALKHCPNCKSSAFVSVTSKLETPSRRMAEDIKCPECGSETVIRTVKKGPNVGHSFYVCTRYPECKGKVAIEKQADRISLTNEILRFLMSIIVFVLAIPTMVTTFSIGCLFALPPVGLIYVLIMTLIWLPFLGFMIGTSWLWEKVRILRLPLALIGIPIVIIIDTFLLLMPNPDKEDKIRKFAICDSWPFSREVVRSKSVNTDIMR